MKYSKSAIGLLTAQYRSVLKKCWMINVGLFALMGATFATPAEAGNTETVLYSTQSLSVLVPGQGNLFVTGAASGIGTIDLTSYVTSYELDDKLTGYAKTTVLSDYVKTTDMNSRFTNYYTKDEILKSDGTGLLSSYYTKDELTGTTGILKGYATTASLNAYATTASLANASVLKATQDGDGNVIATTYATNSSLADYAQKSVVEGLQAGTTAFNNVLIGSTTNGATLTYADDTLTVNKAMQVANGLTIKNGTRSASLSADADGITADNFKVSSLKIGNSSAITGVSTAVEAEANKLVTSAAVKTYADNLSTQVYNGTNKFTSFKMGDAEITGIVTEVASNNTDKQLATAKAVYTAIGDAKTAAATDAQTRVDALANGQVKTNKEAIEALNADATNDKSIAYKIKTQASDATYNASSAAGSIGAAIKTNADKLGTGNFNTENGNIASATGSVVSAVNDLDKSIGNVYGLTSGNLSTATKPSVAQHLQALSDSIGNRAYSGKHYLTANESVAASLGALDAAAYNNLHGVAGQTLTVGDEGAKVRVGKANGDKFNGLDIDNSTKSIALLSQGTTPSGLNIASTGEISLGTAGVGTDFYGVRLSNSGKTVTIEGLNNDITMTDGAINATSATLSTLTLGANSATAIDDGSAIDLTSATAPAAGTLATTSGVYNTVKGISDSLGDYATKVEVHGDDTASTIDTVKIGDKANKTTIGKLDGDQKVVAGMAVDTDGKTVDLNVKGTYTTTAVNVADGSIKLGKTGASGFDGIEYKGSDKSITLGDAATGGDKVVVKDGAITATGDITATGAVKGASVETASLTLGTGTGLTPVTSVDDGSAVVTQSTASAEALASTATVYTAMANATETANAYTPSDALSASGKVYEGVTTITGATGALEKAGSAIEANKTNIKTNTDAIADLNDADTNDKSVAYKIKNTASDATYNASSSAGSIGAAIKTNVDNIATNTARFAGMTDGQTVAQYVTAKAEDADYTGGTSAMSIKQAIASKADASSLGTVAKYNLATTMPEDADHIETWAGTNADKIANIGTTFNVFAMKLTDVQSDLMAAGDNESSIARALGGTTATETLPKMVQKVALEAEYTNTNLPGATTVKTALDKAADLIDANADEITTLKAADTEAGSVKNSIKTLAKDAIYKEATTSPAAPAVTIGEQIAANEAAIDTLNGTGDDSVAGKINAQAENAKYTPSTTSGDAAVITANANTINGAILALDKNAKAANDAIDISKITHDYAKSGTTAPADIATAVQNVATNAANNIGTMAFNHDPHDTAAISKNLTYDGTTHPVTPNSLTMAVNSLDLTLGTIHGLKNVVATSTDDYVKAGAGNLAAGTTVENHLTTLASSIGDRNYTATTGSHLTANQSVAASLRALDTAVMGVEGNYVTKEYMLKGDTTVASTAPNYGLVSIGGKSKKVRLGTQEIDEGVSTALKSGLEVIASDSGDSLTLQAKSSDLTNALKMSSDGSSSLGIGTGDDFQGIKLAKSGSNMLFTVKGKNESVEFNDGNITATGKATFGKTTGDNAGIVEIEKGSIKAQHDIAAADSILAGSEDDGTLAGVKLEKNGTITISNKLVLANTEATSIDNTGLNVTATPTDNVLATTKTVFATVNAATTLDADGKNYAEGDSVKAAIGKLDTAIGTRDFSGTTYAKTDNATNEIAKAITNLDAAINTVAGDYVTKEYFNNGDADNAISMGAGAKTIDVGNATSKLTVLAEDNTTSTKATVKAEVAGSGKKTAVEVKDGSVKLGTDVTVGEGSQFSGLALTEGGKTATFSAFDAQNNEKKVEIAGGDVTADSTVKGANLEATTALKIGATEATSIDNTGAAVATLPTDGKTIASTLTVYNTVKEQAELANYTPETGAATTIQAAIRANDAKLADLKNYDGSDATTVAGAMGTYKTGLENYADTKVSALANGQVKTNKDNIAKVLSGNALKNVITTTRGQAMIWNEHDGGGAMYTHADGNKSFVGVHDGSAGMDIGAQIYTLDKDGNGTRLNVNQDGIFYVKGAKGQGNPASAEITTLATAKDGIYDDTGVTIAEAIASAQDAADSKTVTIGSYDAGHGVTAETATVADGSATATMLTLKGAKDIFAAKQAWLDGFTGIRSDIAPADAFAAVFADNKNIMEGDGNNRAAPTSIAMALQNLDYSLGTIHGLAASLGNDYKGNLAAGTSVSDHLTALDSAIGNRAQYIDSHYANTGTEAIDNATAIHNMDTAIFRAISDIQSDYVTKEYFNNGDETNKAISMGAGAQNIVIGHVADDTGTDTGANINVDRAANTVTASVVTAGSATSGVTPTTTSLELSADGAKVSSKTNDGTKNVVIASGNVTADETVKAKNLEATDGALVGTDDATNGLAGVKLSKDGTVVASDSFTAGVEGTAPYSQITKGGATFAGANGTVTIADGVLTAPTINGTTVNAGTLAMTAGGEATAIDNAGTVMTAAPADGKTLASTLTVYNNVQDATTVEAATNGNYAAGSLKNAVAKIDQNMGNINWYKSTHYANTSATPTSLARAIANLDAAAYQADQDLATEIAKRKISLNNVTVGNTDDVEVATIEDGIADHTANVLTVAGATTIFRAKQDWMDAALGIDSDSSNPYETVFGRARYVANATTMTGAIMNLDGALGNVADNYVTKAYLDNGVTDDTHADFGKLTIGKGAKNIVIGKTAANASENGANIAVDTENGKISANIVTPASSSDPVKTTAFEISKDGAKFADGTKNVVIAEGNVTADGDVTAAKFVASADNSEATAFSNSADALTANDAGATDATTTMANIAQVYNTVDVNAEKSIYTPGTAVITASDTTIGGAIHTLDGVLNGKTLTVNSKTVGNTDNVEYATVTDGDVSAEMLTIGGATTIFRAKQDWMDAALGIDSDSSTPFAAAFNGAKNITNDATTTMTGAIMDLDGSIADRKLYNATHYANPNSSADDDPISLSQAILNMDTNIYNEIGDLDDKFVTWTYFNGGNDDGVLSMGKSAKDIFIGAQGTDPQDNPVLYTGIEIKADANTKEVRVMADADSGVIVSDASIVIGNQTATSTTSKVTGIEITEDGEVVTIKGKNNNVVIEDGAVTADNSVVVGDKTGTEYAEITDALATFKGANGTVTIADGTVTADKFAFTGGAYATDIDSDGSGVLTPSANILASTATVKAASDALWNRAEGVFNEKQAWMDRKFGILSARPNPYEQAFNGALNLTNDETTTMTGAIMELDGAIGNRNYTNPNFLTSGESVAESLVALDTAIGDISDDYVTWEYYNNGEPAQIDDGTGTMVDNPNAGLVSMGSGAKNILIGKTSTASGTGITSLDAGLAVNNTNGNVMLGKIAHLDSGDAVETGVNIEGEHVSLYSANGQQSVNGIDVDKTTIKMGIITTDTSGNEKFAGITLNNGVMTNINADDATKKSTLSSEALAITDGTNTSSVKADEVSVTDGTTTASVNADEVKVAASDTKYTSTTVDGMTVKNGDNTSTVTATEMKVAASDTKYTSTTATGVSVKDGTTTADLTAAALTMDDSDNKTVVSATGMTVENDGTDKTTVAATGITVTDGASTTTVAADGVTSSKFAFNANDYATGIDTAGSDLTDPNTTATIDGHTIATTATVKATVDGIVGDIEKQIHGDPDHPETPVTIGEYADHTVIGNVTDTAGKTSTNIDVNTKDNTITLSASQNSGGTPAADGTDTSISLNNATHTIDIASSNEADDTETGLKIANDAAGHTIEMAYSKDNGDVQEYSGLKINGNGTNESGIISLGANRVVDGTTTSSYGMTMDTKNNTTTFADKDGEGVTMASGDLTATNSATVGDSTSTDYVKIEEVKDDSGNVTGTKATFATQSGNTVIEDGAVKADNSVLAGSEADDGTLTGVKLDKDGKAQASTSATVGQVDDNGDLDGNGVQMKNDGSAKFAADEGNVNIAKGAVQADNSATIGQVDGSGELTGNGVQMKNDGSAKFASADGNVEIAKGAVQADNSVLAGSEADDGTLTGVKLDKDGKAQASASATVGQVDNNGDLDGNGVQMKNDGSATFVADEGKVDVAKGGVTADNNVTVGDNTSDDYIDFAKKDDGSFGATFASADGNVEIAKGEIKADNKITVGEDKVVMDKDGNISAEKDLSVKGLGTFGDSKKVVINEGNITADGDITAENGTVTGKDVVANESFTLAGVKVKAIDNSNGKVEPSVEVLATTASIFRNAEDADYSGGTFVTADADTIKDALEAIDETIGDFPEGLNLKNHNLDNNTGVAPKTVVEAFNNIDATMGQIHGLAKKLESEGTYMGNLAEGTTVEQHLAALDKSIGDRRNYSQQNVIKNKQAVAESLDALDVAVGDISKLQGTTYANADNLSDAVVQIDDKLQNLDGRMESVEHDLKDVHHELRRGMASMAAMSALVPNSRSTGKTSLSVGTGAYSGHTAVAVGGFHYLTDNLMFNAGAAWSNSRDAVYRVGMTYSF